MVTTTFFDADREISLVCRPGDIACGVVADSGFWCLRRQTRHWEVSCDEMANKLKLCEKNEHVKTLPLKVVGCSDAPVESPPKTDDSPKPSAADEEVKKLREAHQADIAKLEDALKKKETEMEALREDQNHQLKAMETSNRHWKKNWNFDQGLEEKYNVQSQGGKLTSRESGASLQNEHSNQLKSAQDKHSEELEKLKTELKEKHEKAMAEHAESSEKSQKDEHSES